MTALTAALSQRVALRYEPRLVSVWISVVGTQALLGRAPDHGQHPPTPLVESCDAMSTSTNDIEPHDHSTVTLEPAPEVPGLSRPGPGVVWVFGVFIGAIASYLGMRWVNSSGLDTLAPPLASIWTSTVGAAIATALALAGYGPFARISPRPARAATITVFALVTAFVSWQVLHVWFGVDLAALAFPIIATIWFWIAVTSFVGEEAHALHLSPGRRTILNAAVWIGLTLVVVETIAWIPPFWFPLAQTLLVTGGFGYVLRGIGQPVKSLYAWAILTILTALVVGVSIALGLWSSAPPTGIWSIGSPNANWSVFFAVWCGTNFGVLAMVQCWPFSRIRQPFGSVVAMVSVIAWAAVIAAVLVTIFDGLFAQHATALLEAQVYAWHLVFWSLTFPLVWGVGSAPYRWVGQSAPGVWEDTD